MTVRSKIVVAVVNHYYFLFVRIYNYINIGKMSLGLQNKRKISMSVPGLLI